MHYLESHFDSALEKIVHYLVPEHHYKSVHDFFNPSLFHTTLLAILPNIPQLNSHLGQLISIATPQQSGELGSSSGFVEDRIRNFTAIWKAMERALSIQGHEVRQMSKENMFKMVKQCDLDCLQIFLQHLFQLLIKHHGAVQYITELPSDDQATIKDFLQRGKDKIQQHLILSAAKEQQQDELKKLTEQNLELRHNISSVQNDILKLSSQVQELEDQLSQLRQIDSKKENEIYSLKKRLLAYEETDTLFQQKDQQILKLNKTLAELQLSNRLLTSDLNTQKTKHETKISDLEHSNLQFQTKLQKLSTSFELLFKQKEEIEQSNKKVIANLKDKIKNQTERIAELQTQLVESKISRELRERQFSELWSNYESLRSQSFNDTSLKITGPLENAFSTDIEKGIISASGNHREFLRLGEQINQLDKLQQNAFEQQIMMFQSTEDNLKKVQQIITENTKLKQKLNLLESKEAKFLSQQNEKLKKKLIVMKKRNEEIETQRKEEIDVLVSAFEHLLRNKKQ